MANQSNPKRSRDKGKDCASLLENADNFDNMFHPLPVTPVCSPGPKKQRGGGGERMDADREVSNADILNAVMESTNAVNSLSQRFTTLELDLQKNTSAILKMTEQMNKMETRVKNNEDKVKEMSAGISMLNKKSEEPERYSRRWNLRVQGLRETPGEKVREDVMKLFAVLAPEDKEKLGFLVDTVHRVGVLRDNGIRPIIVQFTMRSFRDKIWLVSKNSGVLKDRKLMIKEDLTQVDKEERRKLWPLVEAARKDGKRAGFRGTDAYIEGKKVTL